MCLLIQPQEISPSGEYIKYIKGSLVSVSASRSSSQTKPGKEKSSRSPLRATTLESNVKKSNRVEFREPLASYRLSWNNWLLKIYSHKNEANADIV